MRGDGPFSIVYKGDDFCKSQCNLQIDKDRLRSVNDACSLNLKVQVGKGAEFCGLTVCENQIVPSLPRSLNKSAGHHFHDYRHWCEYQTSLRDWIAVVKVRGSLNVIAANTVIYNTTVEEMRSLYETIESLAHIGEQQWRLKVQKFIEPVGIPQKLSSGLTVVNM